MILVVGSGRLAQELLSDLDGHPQGPVARWDDLRDEPGALVVHAGSGRERQAALGFCGRNRGVFVELATDAPFEGPSPGFPVVLCPNTNLLILKVLAMVDHGGPSFAGFAKTLVESHQRTKTTAPGTAYDLARSLGIPERDVISVRDRQDRHAHHRLTITDGPTTVVLETRIEGPAPYAAGLAQILSAIAAHPLEPRVYSVLEFVKNGWL